jgi:hypothetical protein
VTRNLPGSDSVTRGSLKREPHCYRNAEQWQPARRTAAERGRRSCRRPGRCYWKLLQAERSSARDGGLSTARHLHCVDSESDPVTDNFPQRKSLRQTVAEEHGSPRSSHNKPTNLTDWAGSTKGANVSSSPGDKREGVQWPNRRRKMAIGAEARPSATGSQVNRLAELPTSLQEWCRSVTLASSYFLHGRRMVSESKGAAREPQTNT